jgi:CarboxypepD_reg-like domain
MSKIIFISIVLNLFFLCCSTAAKVDNNITVIQNSTGIDSLYLKIIDLETGEAIAGANIILLNTSVGTVSDINGQAFLPKGLEGKVRVVYIGYENAEIEIKSRSIDSMLIKLKPKKIWTTADLHNAIIEDGVKDAETDLKNGKIQLIHYKEPTLDEKAFAKNHSFTFVNGEKERLPRIYRLSYNGVMLKYLANKFGKEIYEELESLYNRNN